MNLDIMVIHMYGLDIDNLTFTEEFKVRFDNYFCEINSYDIGFERQ